MFFAFALFLAGAAHFARGAVTKEYQVKAVFLFNFAQFVQWPPKALKGSEPFCIGVLGEDPFDGFLDETVKGEMVDGHPLVVRRFASVEEVKKCQILFISRSEMGRLDAIFAALKGRSILTVGDDEGFIRKGGITRFVMDQNKVHLRISPNAAKREGLVISSKLLRLAEIEDHGEMAP